MEEIKLLIIEDTASDIQTYKDTLKTVNMEIAPAFYINAIFKSNKKDGLDALEKLKDELSGAFIDLKLQTGAPADVNEGNEIVAEIYGKLRFPVIVLTNTPASFDTKFKKSLFLQVFTKTEVDFYELYMKLIKIYKTGITKILGKKGIIEMMLDEIFWNNISNSLEEWLEIETTEKPLLRYALTHLLEHLEITDDRGSFDIVYPVENYIKPSIKKYFYTGDIIIDSAEKKKRYVILTPACDLAPHGADNKPKATNLIVAEIENFEDTPVGTLIRRAKKDAANSDEELSKKKARDTIFKFITNDSSPKYYYLPDTKIVKGGLVNFQKLSSVKISELKRFEKEATITTQFVKDIIAKFSFYYSRQGSPDFNYDGLLEYHVR